MELPDLPDLPDVPLREDDSPLSDDLIEGLRDSSGTGSDDDDTALFGLDAVGDDSSDSESVTSDETVAFGTVSPSDDDISFGVTFDESVEEPVPVMTDDASDDSSLDDIFSPVEELSDAASPDPEESLVVDLSNSDFTLDLPDLPSEETETRETATGTPFAETETETETETEDLAFFGNEEASDTVIDDLPADFGEELSDTLPEMEIPLASDAALPAEDDFADFLADLSASESKPASPVPASDTLDLDSFINEFNETGGTPAEERDKLFEDVEPVEIDLDFDESFIEDSERIKASGSSVSEHEFVNSEFGVELVDETSVSGETSFDDMLEKTVSDDASRTEFSAPADDVSGLESTSEFDDLLASLDAAPVTQMAKEPRKPAQTANTFELNVTEEDGLGSVAANVTADRADEDIAVSLDETEGDTVASLGSFGELSASTFPSSAVEENLDILEIKDYNIETSERESVASDSLVQDTEVSLDFDDISAVEQELSDGTPETGEDAVVSNDKSTELLMVIADELSSIKQEISTLKAELAGFKGLAQSGDSTASSESDATDNSGFFSDDDNDEAIALTGDELNNILITADFTEEKTDDTSAETASDFVSDEIPSVDIEFPAEAASSSDEPEIPETLPDSIFDIPDLDTSSEIEISHVNSIEDDISYLDGNANQEPDLDNVAIEEPELEIIDFNDEKLEEPELTEFSIDLADIENGFPSEQTVSVEPYEPLAVEAELPPLSEEVLETPAEPTVSVTPVKQEDSRADATQAAPSVAALPVELKDEIKSVLSYMDQLLESLPEDKIEEFARSEHFEVYRKLFEELGIS